MKKMREGKDYQIIMEGGDSKSPARVKLLKKPYKDVIIQYGKLKISQPGMDGFVTANFNFDFIDKAGKSNELFEEAEFNNYLGDVLFSILEENLNSLDQVKPEDLEDEIREDLVEEPDLERGVRTKSSSVRKR